jgi:hypothetical protein
MTRKGHALLFYQGKSKMNGGKTMNIRKNIDYSEIYIELDKLMEQQLPQMELYCEIGKAVCRRTEKGAAVMASEYLNKQYPDVKGFSPRSLRRMRDFYRTYENHSALLSCAMKLGWIQNVVIMEADLTMDLREWYMKAAEQFGWSKTELIANIAANVHENIALTIGEDVCNIVEQTKKQIGFKQDMSVDISNAIRQSVRRIRKWWLVWRAGRRRWHTMLRKLVCEV